MTAIGTPTRLGSGFVADANAASHATGASSITTPAANQLVLVATVAVRDNDTQAPNTLTPSGLGISNWTELGTAGGIIVGGADQRRLQVWAGYDPAPSGTNLLLTSSATPTTDGWGWMVAQFDANVNPADAFVGSPYTLVDASTVTTSTLTAWPAALASLENAGIVFWVRSMTEAQTIGGTGWSAFGSGTHALATPGANQRLNFAYALGSNGNPGDPTITGASGALSAGFALEIKAIAVVDPSYSCVV